MLFTNSACNCDADFSNNEARPSPPLVAIRWIAAAVSEVDAPALRPARIAACASSGIKSKGLFTAGISPRWAASTVLRTAPDSAARGPPVCKSRSAPSATPLGKFLLSERNISEFAIMFLFFTASYMCAHTAPKPFLLPLILSVATFNVKGSKKLESSNLSNNCFCNSLELSCNDCGFNLSATPVFTVFNILY